MSSTAAKPMHEAMARIYAAAREAGKLSEEDGPAALARLVNQSTQTIYNWERRRTGPSQTALLLIQDKLHINATWVEKNHGPMFIDQTHQLRERRQHYSHTVPDLRSSEASRIQATIAQLGELLARHNTRRQQTIASVLARFASDPTDAELAKELAMLLQQGADRGIAGKQSAA